MLKIINKSEFFDALSRNVAGYEAHSLKFIQDVWFYDFFARESIASVLEIGGGSSRTLPRLAKKSVECWNADKFEGVAGGPTKDNICYQRQLDHGIKIVDVYVGSDSSQQLPSEYFDLVYSISVIEHLDRNAIVDCFKECKRILKPGGRMYHAIDYFLDVEIYEDTHNKIENLRFAAEVAGFAPIGDDEVGQHPTFKSKYATPSDFFLSANWCHVKSLKNLVEKLSLVSLVSGHIKA